MLGLEDHTAMTKPQDRGWKGSQATKKTLFLPKICSPSGVWVVF